MKPSLNQIFLIPLMAMIMFACNSGGGSNHSADNDKRTGNCTVYGHRNLVNNGLPVNNFEGSYYSLKKFTNNNASFEWYPLALSISESKSSMGTRMGYIGEEGSEECTEVLSMMINRYYSYSTDNHTRNLSLKLTYPDFQFDEFSDFDESTPDKLESKDVTPSISIVIQELEEISSSTNRVINEWALETESLSCRTNFQVNTFWKKGDFDSTIANETQAFDSANNFYYVTHEAEFTGDNCTFEAQHTFTTKNNVEIQARIYAGIEKLTEEDDPDGYRLNITGIDIL